MTKFQFSTIWGQVSSQHAILIKKEATLLIVKHRSFPYKLLGMEASLRRLPQDHPQIDYFQQSINSIKAGIGGEKSLDHYFEQDAFHENHFVFQDIGLNSSGIFQIDYLYINPYFAVIFEVKNISGDIFISNDNPRLKRVRRNGKVDYFRNPLRQVSETTDLFNDFLIMNGFDLPVYNAVAFKQYNFALEFEKTKIPVLSIQDIPGFIRRLPRTQKILTPWRLIELIELILNKHKNYIPFPITNYFEISSEEFQTGVYCENCNSFGMRKLPRSWLCPKCGLESKTAHIQAIHDYCMLINSQISNEECRKFLNLKDSKTSSRLLRSMDLLKKGSSQKRLYYLDYQKL